MCEPVVFIFENKELLVQGFSEWFVKKVNAQTGPFFVALSGGSTPGAWFNDLAKNHHDDLDWSGIHLFWGDERCVPPDDEQSNYGMTKKYLLDHVPVPLENIHRVHGEELPVDAAVQYEKEIRHLVPGDPIPRFDLVILGMGEDGHTASIFPHQIAYWEAEKLCIVADHPSTGQQRVSITGQLINAAKDVAFLVSGAEKAPKIHEIVNRKAGYTNYPAALANPESGSLQWFLDAPAAKLIDHEA